MAFQPSRRWGEEGSMGAANRPSLPQPDGCSHSSGREKRWAANGDTFTLVAFLRLSWW